MPGVPSLPLPPLVRGGAEALEVPGRALPGVTEVLSSPHAHWGEHWTGEEAVKPGRRRKSLGPTAHLQIQGQDWEKEGAWAAVMPMNPERQMRRLAVCQLPNCCVTNPRHWLEKPTISYSLLFSGLAGQFGFMFCQLRPFTAAVSWRLKGPETSKVTSSTWLQLTDVRWELSWLLAWAVIPGTWASPHG